MQDPKNLDLEMLIVEKLQGKLTLLQSRSEKESMIASALSEARGSQEKRILEKEIQKIANSEERAQFIKNFLSYGVIEDLLCDSQIEDIIINSLNTIYVHHSERGLISTNKRFSSQR